MGLIAIVSRLLSDILEKRMPPTPSLSSVDPSRIAYKATGHTGGPISHHLRILSLNVWGLPVAPLCNARASALADNFKNLDVNVIVLQEVWHERERNLFISKGASTGFVYHHYFKSAVGFPFPIGGHACFSTGLLVLSKFPIIHASYRRFTVSGRVYALHESDYLASKGCGLVRIMFPGTSSDTSTTADIYVTHLLANYNYLGAPGDGDKYLAHRAAQAYELTQFMNETSKSDLAVLCGDLNSPDDCLCLRIPMELGKFRDAFREANPKDEGLTFASTDNKFSHGEHPMRMDYILFKTKSSDSDNASSSHWKLGSSSVYKQFFQDAKGDGTPVSDHFGVTANFDFGSYAADDISNLNETSTHLNRRMESRSDSFCSVHSLLDTAITIDSFAEDVETPSSPSACLNELLRILNFGYHEAQRRRLHHFFQTGVTFVIIIFVLLASSLLNGFSMVEKLTMPFLLVYLLVQYFLAQVTGTWECGSFAEILSQVRLHGFRLSIMQNGRSGKYK